MQKLRRLRAPEKTRQLDLPAGGLQQILAADDVRDTLHVIVDGGGELVRPVPRAIANQHVAALLGRPLLLRTEPQIDEPFHRRREPDAEPETGCGGESTAEIAIATRARIAEVVRGDV